MQLEIGNSSQAINTVLQNEWMSSVPNDGKIYLVIVNAMYGNYYGIISRYSNSYGNALLQRYNGSLYAVFLDNGTVTGYNVNKTAW